MSIGPEPVPPDVDAEGFSDGDLVDYICAADRIEARGHAQRLLSIARLARRRRGVLGTADGRGGPGVDSRALARPELLDVREDFVAELALTRGCSEAEAAA